MNSHQQQGAAGEQHEAEQLFDSQLNVNDNVLNRFSLPRNAILPLVVISIAGYYRQGKSTLMNFLAMFLERLSAFQQQNLNNSTDFPTNWMTGSNHLPQVFHFRSGHVAETKGAWVTAPVVIRTSRGEMAVVLADSEGGNDPNTERNADKNIFALSTMLSNVQIYNIQGRMGRNHLEDAAQFAGAAQQACRGMFQHFLFLQRDFVDAEDFGGYGFVGGRCLLQSTAVQGHGQNDMLNALNAIFSKVDCFALPYPGRKLASGKIGKTSAARFTEMDQEFLDEVKVFTETLLAPAALYPKTSPNGREMTCADFVVYIKSVALECKNQKSIDGAYRSWAKFSCGAECDGALTYYKNEMSSQLPDTLIVTDFVTQFEPVHISAQQMALELYDQGVVLLGAQFATEVAGFRTKLIDQITCIYEERKHVALIRYEAEQQRQRDEAERRHIEEMAEMERQKHEIEMNEKDEEVKRQKLAAAENEQRAKEAERATAEAEHSAALERVKNEAAMQLAKMELAHAEQSRNEADQRNREQIELMRRHNEALQAAMDRESDSGWCTIS